ncbi:hypothetical protein [Enterococcus hermanniensis]|uniref:Uncharacterized protein n=1 Tax=Enterococcus hermanniensis TaxID=249189 RepID=A0A1L8TQK1_9ENTE|nr:hypothetical protein [Enterococcus hermanniensis]OJG46591.1 hypothetical protein RV04_GL001019 [Enterococcus hermanniensis]
MYQYYSIRIVLGSLLIIYGIGLIVWTFFQWKKTHDNYYLELFCGLGLLFTGVIAIILKVLP